MLGLLPHHLVQVILDDYVDASLSTVSHLDVAFCSSGLRDDFLEVISSLKRVTTRRGKPVENNNLSNYLSWLESRQCHIPSLEVDPRGMPNFSSGDLLLLPQIHSVVFNSFGYNRPNVPTPFLPFLFMFPGLKELNCSKWATIRDGFLCQLKSLQCPLEVLQLSRCHQLTSECVVGVVSHFSATLRRLDCDVLDDLGLVQLSQLALPKFQQLSMHSGLESSVAIEQFCESVSETLESLSFRYVSGKTRSLAITNNTIKQITKSCPRLKTINCRSGTEASLQCLPDVMAGCPNIEKIYFRFVTIVFNNGKPAVHDSFDLRCDPNVMLQRCAEVVALGIQVRSVTLDVNNHLADCMRFIADNFGHQLTTFTGFFTENDYYDGDGMLIYLLAHCPNLQKVELYDFIFSDRSLSQIPVYCPKIDCLAVCHSDLINGDTVLKVMQQFQGNAMKEVVFKECNRMTQETAKAIAALFLSPDMRMVVEYPTK